MRHKTLANRWVGLGLSAGTALFAKVLKLGRVACEKYLLPHATRSIFLRCEELTRKPSHSECYDQIGARNWADDDRTTFWRSKTLDDFGAFAPDSNAYLKSYPADINVLAVAVEYKMHPLMISCWTCLIGKAVDDFGLAATAETLLDDNEVTMEICSRHLQSCGKDLPPSMSILMKAFGHPPLTSSR